MWISPNALSLLDGDEAIQHIHPDDRARVLEAHAGLPGQTLGTTCANLLHAWRVTGVRQIHVDSKRAASPRKGE